MRPILSQFKDEGFVFPDYKNSNMQVLKEIAYGNDRRTGSKKKKIFMVVDGLGYNLLTKTMPNLPGYPELSSLSTVYPSNTPVVMASIEGGKTPAEHGIIGAQVYDKEIGGIVMPFKDYLVLSKNYKLGGAGIRSLIPEPNMLMKISEKKNMLVQYQESMVRIHDDKLKNTRIKYHSAHLDMFLSLKREVLQDKQDFVYAYTDVIDHIQHVYGPSSEEAAHYIKLFFSDFEKILLPALIRNDYNLVITSDHGIIDATDKISINYNDKIMDYLIMPPYGDPRTRYFHVPNDKWDKFEKYFNAKYGKHALLLRSSDAIKVGLFGKNSVTEKMRARFGTHVAIMKGHGTFKYNYPLPQKKYQYQLLGHHSGMSEDEMRVPLLVY